jgi:four helix bundle protein
MKITSYRDLDAWQLGMDLAEAVYRFTSSFPSEERFVLSAQLRRAATGIPSNVSEGHQLGRKSYRHHVLIALGCQAECETQLELARRLQFGSEEACLAVIALAARVGKVLHGLERSLPVLPGE